MQPAGRLTLALGALVCLALVALNSPLPARADIIQLANILPKLQAIHEDAKSLLIKNAELKNKILAGLQAQNEAKLQPTKPAPAALAAGNAAPAAPATGAEAKLQPHPLRGPAAGPVSPSVANGGPAAPVSSEAAIDNKKPAPSVGSQPPEVHNAKTPDAVDFSELEEFNKWIEINLEYAVKNTQASIDALKDEAHQSNGNVDYSEQAIKDGIEGVKYWQSAVIFQDKTLNHEKFTVE